MHGNIVDFDRIGNRRNHAVGCIDFLRQVIDDPVRDIFHTRFAQEIERLFRFRKSRTFPAAGPFAAEGFNGVHRFCDRGSLIAECVHRTLKKPVAHELPIRLKCRFGDTGIRAADASIDCKRHRYVPRYQCRVLSPEAGTHPVFMPGPVGNIWQQRPAHWRWQHRTRHRTLNSPFLDVKNHPDGQPLAIRQLQPRAIDDRLIRNAIGQRHQACSPRNGAIAALKVSDALTLAM